jgi:hypothetical protein
MCRILRRLPLTLVAGFCLLHAATSARAQEAPLTPARRVVVLRAAEQALTITPPNVMQKPRVPPSGDKHDFLSLAPYWWPDPAKADGLPYIRRDGETNPESKRGTDDEPFVLMNTTAWTLGRAYAETKDERFAARAALLLRTWFLDPATRMNPNLDYGQAVPGHNAGRGAGIISTRRLVRVIDAARRIEASPSWTAADKAGLSSWCRAYATWLRTSKNGREEAQAANNHGTWYDAQLVALLLYTGQRDEARSVIEASSVKRLASQIEPDGRQPEELARTKSWSYSVMNLEGWVSLAEMATEAGTDLWHYRTPDGRSLRQAFAFLIPFAPGGAPWPYPQITHVEADEFPMLLREAARVWPDVGYLALADRLDAAAGAVR